MGIQGQTAIVTGGARGIGLGIARRLAADGAQVVLWDLDFDRFDRAAAGFEPARLDVVDVTDPASIGAGVAAAISLQTGQGFAEVDIAAVQRELRRQGARIA